MVGSVHHDQATDVSQHERFVRHPVQVAEHEAEHMREIADEGVSPATPAIVVVAVIAFIVPFVAILVLLVFTIAHFS
jgi:hypothetical protein